MSTRHLECFSTISSLSSVGYVQTGASLAAGAGRLSGDAMRLSGSASGLYHPGHLYSACSSGAAIQPIGSDAGFFLRLISDTESTGSPTAGVFFWHSGGVLYMAAGGSTTVLRVLQAGEWNYYELSADVSGAWVARINGEVVASGTEPTAAGAKKVLFGRLGGATSADYYACDWYIKNDTSFLGDLQVTPRIPTADAATAWTPLAGLDNYAMVDEVPPDGDTSYVSAAIAATQDYYSSTDVLPGTVLAVHAVGTRTWARKDDTEVREIRTNLRSNAVVANGSTVVLGTSYAARDDVYDTNPDGGGAWDQATAEASEWGPEVVT